MKGSLAAGWAGLCCSPANAAPEPNRLPSELVGEIGRLQGIIRLGSQQPDVTIFEFFDYNCPYCRLSAKDTRPLITSDRNLRYVLVNYAVLGEASILASKVALAFSMQKPAQYLAFHENLLGRKGVNGAEQSIDVALTLGANKARLLKDADSEAVTKALIASAKLGENLGLIATPSYVIGNDGFNGFISLPEKKAMIANMRKCEKTDCGG